MTDPIDNLRQASAAVSGLEPLSPSIISAARIEDSVAKAYRLARRNGELVLQGCFQWRQGNDYGHEWRDVPIVDLEEAMTDVSPMQDLHYEWELEDADGEWQAGGSSNLLEDARREGMRYLTQYSNDGYHKLIIREHCTRTIQEITND